MTLNIAHVLPCARIYFVMMYNTFCSLFLLLRAHQTQTMWSIYKIRTTFAYAKFVKCTENKIDEVTLGKAE